MRMRIMLVPALALALAACGSGNRNDRAAKACEAEIAKRLSGKSYEIDLGDLAAHATAEGADMLTLSSTAVFDKGLSTEYKQTYTCRARVDGGTASVINLEFYWNTSDLSKSRVTN